MRKEKIEELEIYIEELKIKKMELLDASGRFLNSERYSCELNNGKVMIREKLVKNGSDGCASIILPITAEGDTLLVVQPRISGVMVELPAGYVNQGECYEEAARRELFEETGFVPENMILLGKFYQDQGCSTAYNQTFLATGCRKISEQHLDKDEFIRYFECKYSEALELVDMGIIRDIQTQFTLEKSKQYLKNGFGS